MGLQELQDRFGGYNIHVILCEDYIMNSGLSMIAVFVFECAYG